MNKSNELTSEFLQMKGIPKAILRKTVDAFLFIKVILVFFLFFFNLNY